MLSFVNLKNNYMFQTKQHDEKLEEIKNEYYTLMSEQSDVNNDIRFFKAYYRRE